MIPHVTGGDLRGLTIRLLVLMLAMVVAGFVLPSPGLAGGGGGAASARAALYEPMGTPARPTELVVPSLGVRAPVFPIQVEGSTLTPPADGSTVGWWDQSARPGSPKGNTVITGHTLSAGEGAMDRLGTIGRGGIIQVRTPQGTMSYAATRVLVYTKAELAEHALELFRQDRPKNRLVLITCTDWDGDSYNSNVIVFAQPLGVRKAAEGRATEKA